MADAEHGPGATAGAEVLEPFSAATRDWFTGAFAAPTPAQAGAWAAASAGEDALVVAPTGSGKTLAAFLWSLDRLAAAPVPEDRRRRCRVLYVSPLKALAVDVERNLRSPLVGIRRSAVRLGLPEPDVRVAVRSGDTPADERRAFLTAPADVLITTPESLFLLLTSKARESLTGVETVVLDEVHAVAGTKRGAHLAVSLDRLDALLDRPAQRIGLSATVRPVEEVARFLSGGRPVRLVQPPAEKRLELSVVVPVADMSSIGESTGEVSGSAAGEEQRTSIWPHIHERVVDLVAEHTSTLVFANSRRLAERFTAQLNERWAERTAPGEDDAEDGPAHDGAADGPVAAAPARPPAQLMGQAGASGGAPAELARAHHGSVSKEQRAIIEEELKAGRLPAVVATSSLELGIDMGAIDLVVQVESPPSVASGLQRIGRAGHHVGAVSRGVVFPKHRSDLVQAAVVVERMATGDIEAVKVPANPLDVLAQQVVAMCAMDDWPVEQLFALVRRSAAFSGLGRATFEATLDMLAGRYPSEEFAELRPRIVWDRVADTLTGRPGAQRLAVTSGGTIPDRGLFGVFLAGSEGAGRRVGELDEEMVYETRVGDVITLGSSSWRVEDITRDQVLVTPAPGQPGRLPFWHGDGPGRPAELGRALGSFVRELVSASPATARRRALAAGLDGWAADNLLAYLAEQKEATGLVPDDRTVVVERFRDELGDWRVCVHSPFGAQVHAPWALALAARFRERHGIDVQAMHGDDGIVLRLPDVEVAGWGGTEAPGDGSTAEPAWPTAAAVGAFDVGDTVVLEADEVEDVVTAEIGGSALFAARFRECAARALLLPRRTPGRRQPLWQQRQRSASLLEVASRYPAFPIVLETVRECLQDVFDVPGLVALMRGIAARDVRVVEVESATPSPYARSLMFGYVAQFLYEGDSPLAERRAAALSLDPQLLAELLGRGEGASLRDLLEPESVQRTEAELQRLVPERRARHAEDLADLLRSLGPLSTAEVQERSTEPASAPQWLEELVRARRAIGVRIAGEDQWAAVEDAGRLRDALGAALPVGVPDAFLELSPDPLADLLARFARTRGPFPAAAAATRFGLGVAVVTDALRRLEQAGRLTSGQLRPLGAGGQVDALDYCDAQVLRTLRRRSLAALRSEVEPVTPEDYARFLPAWQGVDVSAGGGDRAGSGPTRGRRGGLRGVEGVVRAVEQLTGAQLPASALESLVLPARVVDYSPAMLDELTAAGEVVWTGHGSIGADDGWVSLHLADSVHLTVRPPAPGQGSEGTLTGAQGPAADGEGPVSAGPAGTDDLRRRVLEVLGSGGGFFFRALSDTVGSTDDTALAEVVWDLVWTGRLTNDTVAPLRALTSGGGTHRRRPAPARARYARARPGLGARLPRSGAALPSRSGPPTMAGRWSSVPEPAGDPTLRAAAGAEVLLDRYGVVMRGPVLAEDVPGGFAGVYRVLAGMEDAGRVRRGYFVEGLGAAQFATTGAVDRLRAQAGAAAAGEPRALLLAASDPANPYGAALAWPDRASAATDTGNGTTTGTGTGHRPGRKAGAVVVLVAGALVLYVERGGRSLLTYSDDPAALQAAADALALASRDGGLGRLTVVRTDGAPVLAVGSAVGEALEQAGFRATPRGLRIG